MVAQLGILMRVLHFGEISDSSEQALGSHTLHRVTGGFIDLWLFRAFYMGLVERSDWASAVNRVLILFLDSYAHHLFSSLCLPWAMLWRRLVDYGSSCVVSKNEKEAEQLHKWYDLFSMGSWT